MRVWTAQGAKDRDAVQCSVCKQTFMVTTQRAVRRVPAWRGVPVAQTTGSSTNIAAQTENKKTYYTLSQYFPRNESGLAFGAWVTHTIPLDKALNASFQNQSSAANV